MLEARALRLLTGQCIDLQLERGQIHCLSGASGVGKTLLLRALADLDAADGEVTLHGQSRNSMRPWDWRRQVMLVPTSPRWWHATAGEHFALSDPGWLQRIGLCADLLQTPVAHLSSGESQRLALLRALALQPQVLLLDEPTAALDRDSTAKVEALITDYVQDRRAVLWVSHDAAQAARMARQCWTLDRHQLRASA